MSKQCFVYMCTHCTLYIMHCTRYNVFCIRSPTQRTQRGRGPWYTRSFALHDAQVARARCGRRPGGGRRQAQRLAWRPPPPTLLRHLARRPPQPTQLRHLAWSHPPPRNPLFRRQSPRPPQIPPHYRRCLPPHQTPHPRRRCRQPLLSVTWK